VLKDSASMKSLPFIDNDETLACGKCPMTCQKENCCVLEDEQLDSLTCLRCMDRASAVMFASSGDDPALQFILVLST
jgi:MinD superfamily P-loop ATPase